MLRKYVRESGTESFGRVKGKKYFECKPNFGVFVKPERVKVGDYPVEEINFDDDEEM